MKVSAFALATGIIIPVLAYLIYKNGSALWLPALLILLTMLALLYAWRFGFHPRLRDSKLDVATMLLRASSELASGSEGRVLSMLRGDEPYKYRWCPETVHNERLLMAGPTKYGCKPIWRKIVAFDEVYCFWGERCKDMWRVDLDKTFRSARELRRWLLKLHGSVDRPEDIVITRQDYLRYDDRRSALAGILQALLATREMLFVGFSLKDENFDRVADSVRKALPNAGGRAGRFGTAIFPDVGDVLQMVWGEELELLETGDGRLVDVFLDCVLHHSSLGAAHLLDSSFTGMLTW